MELIIDFPHSRNNNKNTIQVKNYNENLLITPRLNLTITPGISNSGYLSNEDSTNNDLNLENIYRLNRYREMTKWITQKTNIWY